VPYSRRAGDSACPPKLAPPPRLHPHRAPYGSAAGPNAAEFANPRIHTEECQWHNERVFPHPTQPQSSPRPKASHCVLLNRDPDRRKRPCHQSRVGSASAPASTKRAAPPKSPPPPTAKKSAPLATTATNRALFVRNGGSMRLAATRQPLMLLASRVGRSHQFGRPNLLSFGLRTPKPFFPLGRLAERFFPCISIFPSIVGYLSLLEPRWPCFALPRDEFLRRVSAH
jgi:hypothetical protein